MRGRGSLSFQVTTDVTNTIAERGAAGLAELNNAVTINATSQLAPYVDLQVSNLSLEPATGWTPGSSVTVHWRVSNGGDKAVTSPWSDRLVIRNITTGQTIYTGTLNFDPASEGPLAIGASRDRAASITWPIGSGGVGQFEFLVTTDSGSQHFENNGTGTAETNNTALTTIASGPDLAVRNLTVAESSLQAGGLVTVKWETWNDGVAPTPTGFSDRIEIINQTTGQVLISTRLVYDPTIPGNGAIAAGQFRSRTFQYRLPEGVQGAGTLTIRVTADADQYGSGSLYETNIDGTAETNNRTTMTAVAQPRLYADLRVTSLTVPGNGQAGEPISVTWTVQNDGTLAAPVAWNDRVILSHDAILGNADDVVLGTVRHVGTIAAGGGTYTQTSSFTLPTRIEGNYSIFVRADADAEIFEPDTRGNNASTARPIVLTTTYADLVVEAIGLPTSVLSGTQVDVTWRVRNTGTLATDLSQWDDRFILVSDQYPDGVPGYSISKAHTGALAPGESYVATYRLSLPLDMQGTFRVKIITAYNSGVYEQGRTLNNTSTSLTTMTVGLSPVPDLQVSNVTGPASANPGEPVSITYTVNNAGNGDLTTRRYDQIYLDTGTELITVRTLDITETIVANGSSTRTATFNLGNLHVEGTFRWVVKTDVYNDVYERNNENNNQTSSTATVAVARPISPSFR